MTIYFDMDGTIADLYSVPHWLEKLRAEDSTPYVRAAPMCDLNLLSSQIERLQKMKIKIGIISWCSKNGSAKYNQRVRNAKKVWLAHNLPNVHFDEIHIVKYGTSKSKTAHDHGILFDDEEKNREDWEKTNGFAFDAVNLIETLSNLFNIIQPNSGV